MVSESKGLLPVLAAGAFFCLMFVATGAVSGADVEPIITQFPEPVPTFCPVVVTECHGGLLGEVRLHCGPKLSRMAKDHRDDTGL